MLHIQHSQNSRVSFLAHHPGFWAVQRVPLWCCLFCTQQCSNLYTMTDSIKQQCFTNGVTKVKRNSLCFPLSSAVLQQIGVLLCKLRTYMTAPHTDYLLLRHWWGSEVCCSIHGQLLRLIIRWNSHPRSCTTLLALKHPAISYCIRSFSQPERAVPYPVLKVHYTGSLWWDVFYVTWSTSLLQTWITQQLQDGLLLTFVFTDIQVPRQRILRTLVILDFSPAAIMSWHLCFSCFRSGNSPG